MTESSHNTPSDFIRKLLPESIIEVGFLFSILFGALGPIPRYFGFLIAIIGMICRKTEVAYFLKNLPFFVRISFIVMLAWGAVATLSAGSFFYWMKGWSLVFEFEFTVLLAAFVLKSPEAFSRWRMYSYLLVFYVGSFTIWSFVVNGKTESLFSLHTFPSTITIPLLPLALFSLFSKERNLSTYLFPFVGFFLLVSMLLIGLSSGALISNVVIISVFFVIIRPSKKNLALFSLSGIIVVVCLGSTLPLSAHWPIVQREIRSEISQLSAFSNPAKLTSKRSDIWQAAFLIAKEHPEGIGWDQFEKTVKLNIEKKRLTKKHLYPQIHNDYLNVLVEGGVPSFLAYLLFLWECFYILYVLLTGKDRLLAALLCSAFAGVLTFALVGGLFDERKILALYFWTIFGAILSQYDRKARILEEKN